MKMGMIDFVKKHEKVLQREDPGKAALASLKERIEELKSSHPDYQKVADEIYDKLEREDLIAKADDEIRVDDEVIAVGYSTNGVKVEGMRGEVVSCIPSRDLYEVELDGLYCWLPKGNLTKVNVSQKPEIIDKRSYDNFLSTVKKVVKRSFEEYVDYDDKDFKEGDEVITIVEFPMVEKGTRGLIKTKVEDHRNSYVLDTATEGSHFYAESLAKVKKRPKQRKIKVGDKVEVVNTLLSTQPTKEGSWGYVTRISESGKCKLKFEHLITDFPRYSAEWISPVYLRVKDYEENVIHEIITNIEEEFGLSAYEDKKSEISNEISKLAERGISFSELKEYSDILEITNPEEDQELEELLQ